MLYTFKGGSEFVRLKIDRIDKKLEIATSRTTYRFMPQPYWKLFGDNPNDMEGAKKEQAEAELLNDEEFEKKIIASFVKIGYILMKKEK